MPWLSRDILAPSHSALLLATPTSQLPLAVLKPSSSLLRIFVFAVVHARYAQANARSRSATSTHTAGTAAYAEASASD